MNLKEIMQQRKLSIYRLSQLSNVPYSTICDMLKSDKDILESSVLTVHKIALALNVTIESLIEQEQIDFELFKSNVCQEVKRVNDYNFIVNLLKNKTIDRYYKRNLYREAFYLLAMLDYLSRVNHISYCKDYDKLRKLRLAKIVYPRSLLINYEINQDKKILEDARANAIPEFLRFNIVENEIRNVA